MGVIGTIVGALFFVLVLFAALTSSISLMETIVSIFIDKLKIGRKLACVLVFLISLVLGLLSCLGYSAWDNVKIIGLQILDFFDFASNSVIMPIVALATSIFVGFLIKPQTIIDEVSLSGEFKAKRLFSIVIKYVAPVCLVLILVSSVLDVFGIVKI